MNDLANIFANIAGVPDFLSIIKIVLVSSEILYGVFAFIVFKQVKLMNKTFQTNVGPFFTLLSSIHFFAVLALLILSLVIL